MLKAQLDEQNIVTNLIYVDADAIPSWAADWPTAPADAWVGSTYDPVTKAFSPKPQLEPSNAALEAEVRAERDRLLAESDWTQLSDAPVDQAAWAEYRAALRSIPEQEGFPLAVVWPVSPQ